MNILPLLRMARVVSEAILLSGATKQSQTRSIGKISKVFSSIHDVLKWKQSTQRTKHRAPSRLKSSPRPSTPRPTPPTVRHVSHIFTVYDRAALCARWGIRLLRRWAEQDAEMEALRGFPSSDRQIISKPPDTQLGFEMSRCESRILSLAGLEAINSSFRGQETVSSR